MGIILKTFRFLAEIPSIFLKILLNFLNGPCCLHGFLLLIFLIGLFHKFFLFERIFQELYSIIEVIVESFYCCELVFKFKDLLIE